MRECTPLQGFLALGGSEAAIIGMLACIVVIGFVFWIWMLIDCLTNEPSEGNDKLAWLLVIILLHGLGALLYFFIRRTPRIRAN